MSEIAIKVENVSKAFKLPHEKHNSLKSLFLSIFKGKRSYERQQVLKEVSFEVAQGEFFGIVGRNGSGKSTLLKLMAGIYAPDKGTIHVNGKLTPFIELGVGFNQELSGRENIYLNGALLGFNRKEMDLMYKDIVDFAELSDFMDQKLKNYSSGMQVRLAFSIAIRADSRILLLDEVLAVGDAAFQQKCFDVFEKYKAEKQTVILVTHDMESVKRFCTRAMLIKNGQIDSIGSPIDVANNYTEINDDHVDEIMRIRNKQQKAQESVRLKIVGAKNNSIRYVSGSRMRVEVTWPDNIKPKNMGVGIVKNTGEFMYGSNTISLQQKNIKSPVYFDVKLDVGSGKYHLVSGLFGETSLEVIAFNENGPEFVIKSTDDPSIAGLVRLDGKWELT